MLQALAQPCVRVAQSCSWSCLPSSVLVRAGVRSLLEWARVSAPTFLGEKCKRLGGNGGKSVKICACASHV